MNPASSVCLESMLSQPHTWRRSLSPTTILYVALLVVTFVGQSLAQAPITQSGLNTQVSPPIILQSGQTQYNITGGTRPSGGTNLFHSFGDFNVPTHNIANFLNDSGLATSNILGRVTGGNPSVIFGTIQTTGFFGPNGTPTNLFLMNPYGFLFGPNATINIGGMVSFTTADYLRFENTQTLFNNASTAGSLNPLSTAPVAAFGFLGNNPAAIAIQGSTLQVADAQSLSLVGGNKGFTATNPDNGNPIVVPDGITMTGGKLLAPGGQINIVSVAGPGEISSADYMPMLGMAMGNISLTEGALLDVSANAAGTVQIRGGQLVMDNVTISANTADGDGAPTAIDINVTGSVSLSSIQTSALTATTSGAGNAGDITISSGSLIATSGGEDTIKALIDSHSMGSGHGGNVTINTGTLSATSLPLADGDIPARNFISSGTGGDGSGGNVTIAASDALFDHMVIDTGLTQYFGSGAGGNVTITSQSLTFGSSGIDTSSFATAGAINLESAGLLAITLNSNILSQSIFGDGTPITIKADRLVVSGGSQVLNTVVSGNGADLTITSRVVEFTGSATGGGIVGTQTFGDGNAGNIIVTASDHMSFVDDPSSPLPSGLYSSSLGGAGTLGNAGNITVSTPRLELINGARINASTFTSGQGGAVTINSDNILIQGERVHGFIDPFVQGGARASGIYTSSLGSENEFCPGVCGNAGDIHITTGSLTLQTGGQLESSTNNSGYGGNITVSVAGQALLSGAMMDGTPGGIFSQTTGTDPNAGNGGNVLLQANSVSIQNGAQLSASSLGPGDAGNVTIEGTASPAQSVLIDGPGSGVFTDTQGTGAGGNIFVNANTVILQNSGTLSAATSGSAASAVGGTITVEAPNSATMTNGASITASSTGPGNTGNINITAGNQFNMTNSTVTTEANQSGGGIIKITTNPNGTVQLTDSTISASVLDGNGGGGSVNIDPQSVVLINSQILAQAVQGPGGNINITTNLLLPDSTSIISASSQFGQQGTVIIQSPISPASGKIVPLGQKPLIATSLLSQRCAAIAGGTISSFTVAGRDSLPAEPGGWVSTPPALSIAGTEDGTVREADRVMEDETPLLSLRKIAPPGFLTQAFAVDSADCS